MIIARLQHMRIKYKSPLSSFIPAMCLVAQSCPTLCNSVDYSLSGSSVHGDSPSKNTEVGCHFLLQVSSQPRDQTQVSCTAGRFSITEPPGKPPLLSYLLQKQT